MKPRLRKIVSQGLCTIATRIVAVAILLSSAGEARAQERLSGELYKQIRMGIGRLTEAEVLKLVAGPVTVQFGDLPGESDHVFIWEEVCRIRVEFLDGKVASATGVFSDRSLRKT
jgi:hypothetical protein